jgi:PAS domain S-box-containing protein
MSKHAADAPDISASTLGHPGVANSDPARRAADSEELSRAVLSSHPAHIAVLDRTGRIILVNEAWERFAEGNGATASDVGTNYLEVCAGADGDFCAEAPAAVDGIRAVLERRIPVFNLEYPCHAPTGERRFFLLTAAPLRHEKGGAIVSHLDITARKEHEQRLEHRAAELADLSENLARVNRELDQFAYVTSHDLRAPLRGIANLASWIEEDLGEQAVTPEAKKLLDLLRGRVTRMEALIDGILEYSRVGRVAAKAEEVDVRRLLLETVDLLAPQPPAKVQLTTHLPILMTDKLRLQQVFMNLIGNALKHAGRADVTVSVSASDPGGPFLEFAVSDDGVGIEPQYHEKIFVIFQTLAARDKVEGTGVGLSLVKKLVEGNGGRIAVESAPGQGATFRFTWPKRAKGA